MRSVRADDLWGISDDVRLRGDVSSIGQFKSPEDWQEFCALPLEAKQAVAKLYKDAIFSAGGASAWDDLKSFLSEVSTIFGEASGIAQAAAVLIAL